MVPFGVNGKDVGLLELVQGGGERHFGSETLESRPEEISLLRQSECEVVLVAITEENVLLREEGCLIFRLLM